jgi:hypothetical protein
VRTRIVPLALLPLLVLTGCNAGKDAKPDALAATTSPTASSGASLGGSSTPTTSSSQATTTAPSTAASSASPPDALARASAAAPVPAAVTTVAPGKPATSLAAAAGTYTLDSSGTVSYGTPPMKKDAAGTQTLVISALKGDSQQSTLNGDQGRTDETLLVRDTGTYIADIKLSTFNKEFRPAKAVLLVPNPATIGATWSWSGKTTDGKTTISTTGKVARTETLTIGGRKVPCAVVVTHLSLSGDITFDADVTTWWSTDFTLPVKDHSVGKGMFGVYPFSADVTSVMRSTTPS